MFSGRRHRHAGGVPFLTISGPTSSTIRTMHTLQADLRFTVVRARGGVLVVANTAPSDNGAFIDSALTTIVTRSSRGILFVSTSLHHNCSRGLFAIDGRRNLSRCLTNGSRLGGIVRRFNGKNFSIVAHNRIPPGPSRLLVHSQVHRLLR